MYTVECRAWSGEWAALATTENFAIASWSYDHRLTDGFLGVRLMRDGVKLREWADPEAIQIPGGQWVKRNPQTDPAKSVRYSAAAIRDAKWVMSCGAGTPWGRMTGFRPRREQELIDMGVLVPSADGFVVAIVDVEVQ